MNLYNANKQWAERPADERFWTLDEMEKACHEHCEKTIAHTINLRQIGFSASGEEIKMTNQHVGLAPRWDEATLTHWTFGEVCATVKAPAAYLRTLPPTLVAQSLRYGLSQIPENCPDQQLLLYGNGSTRLTGMTSPRYSRIWNWQIVRKLRQLMDAQPGWKVPPARPAFGDQAGLRQATKADVLKSTGSLSIEEGDFIAPAGLYASDHDSFIFLVNESNRLNDGSTGGLSRGIFISNSEVGASSFKISTFLYRHVCGNHIVWDAQSLTELRIRHVGKAPERAWEELSKNLQEHSNESTQKSEVVIKNAKKHLLAASKEKLIEKVSPTPITKKLAEEAYSLALENEKEDGPPLSAWGFAQGVTRLSQTLPFADQRTELDKAAGRIIQMAGDKMLL